MLEIWKTETTDNYWFLVFDVLGHRQSVNASHISSYGRQITTTCWFQFPAVIGLTCSFANINIFNSFALSNRNATTTITVYVSQNKHPKLSARTNTIGAESISNEPMVTYNSRAWRRTTFVNVSKEKITFVKLIEQLLEASVLERTRKRDHWNISRMWCCGPWTGVTVYGNHWCLRYCFTRWTAISILKVITKALLWIIQ